MTNLLFTPILKTKTHSEYHALEAISELLNNQPFCIPYIECIKEFDNRCVQKYISLLSNKSFFLQPLNEDINECIANIDNLPKNCMISKRIVQTTTPQEVLEFLQRMSILNKRKALKIDNADDRFNKYLKLLTKDDFLFIELGGDTFESSSYLDDIRDLQIKCKIIIHSNERFQYLRGEDFADFDYNKKLNFNTSIIDAIKNGKFDFDGFGSRCTAKNENTEEVRIAREVNAVFIVYDYSHNNFFSLTSDQKAHISKVYEQFRPKLLSNSPELYERFFTNTPVSSNRFNFYIHQEKLTSSKLITVSIIRYIEEIINNLL